MIATSNMTQEKPKKDGIYNYVNCYKTVSFEAEVKNGKVRFNNDTGFYKIKFFNGYWELRYTVISRRSW